MNDLLGQIQDWLAAGERIAVATVTRVLGSAPRPVGARMIVSSQGRMAGSVSGGCVETTVYEEMMDVLAGGPPRNLQFGITEDMIWDVGLACGGTIDVFVQELDPALVVALIAQQGQGRAVALVTTIAGGRLGNSALIDDEGLLYGTLDERSVIAARELLAARAEMGAVYGVAEGTTVFVEPFLPPPKMVIVGGVHVAIPLTRFAKQLGFDVAVVDPRTKFANRERFPEADQVWQEWPDEAFQHLAIDDRTYVVLLTHDPKIDEPTLAAALKTEAAYVGAIGSRKTHAGRFERMQEWGITPEQLDRVYGPIGLDLGGHTPEETALSIIAEVVAVKNGRSGGSLRGTARAISQEQAPSAIR